MGNTQTSNYCEQFPLSNSPVVFLHENKFGRGPEAVDTWTAQYKSSGSTCELMAKTNGDYKKDQELTISIHDYTLKEYVKFKFDVSVKEGLLLGVADITGTSVLQLPMRKIPIAEGVVLKITSYFYGSDIDRKGLVVFLSVRTHDDEKVLPYMITIKHYYFSTDYSPGVSLMAKIYSTNDDGGLGVEIENLSKHPKIELLKMFNDAKANGWWPDPTSFVRPMFRKQNKNPARGLSVAIEKPSKHPKTELLKMCDDVKAKGCCPDPTSSDWPMELLNQNKNLANSNHFLSYHKIMTGIINSNGYVKGNDNFCVKIYQKNYQKIYQTNCCCSRCTSKN